jgi:hypothetical protein
VETQWALWDAKNGGPDRWPSQLKCEFLLWTEPDVIAKFQGVSVRRIDAERLATLKKAIAFGE